MSKQRREADRALDSMGRKQGREDLVEVRLAAGVRSSAGTGPAVVRLPRAEAEQLTASRKKA